MSQNVKSVEVDILGSTYVLSCHAEEEQALKDAVSHVDNEMRAIRDQSKIKARERIAVLAALNIAHGLLSKSSAPQAAAAVSVDETLEGIPSWRIKALSSKIDRALASDNQLL
jgi:cell division protein ZapA